MTLGSDGGAAHHHASGPSVDTLVLALSARARDISIRDDRRLNGLLAGIAWGLGSTITEERARQAIKMYRKVFYRSRILKYS